MRNWTKFLNGSQIDWVAEQLQPYKRDLVVVSLHGSHLYGLDREGSDVDIKAVYLPSFQDLLLGESIKTINKKNDELNIEIEIKSLPSFLKSAKSCDTNCIDMLWTPNEMLLSNSSVWEDIQSNRQGLLSKNMKGLIGYIKTHTHKYSNKIQRYQELVDLNAMLSRCDMNKTIEQEVARYVENTDYKYIKIVKVVSDHEQTYLEVCGKKYILSWECKLLKEALDTEIKRYGKRTKNGDKKGLDCKSLSHALRVLVELEELIVEKNITFPLKDSEFLKKVKVGEITDEQVVIDEIDNRFERVMELLEESDLPAEGSINAMLNLLEECYRENWNRYGR